MAHPTAHRGVGYSRPRRSSVALADATAAEPRTIAPIPKRRPLQSLVTCWGMQLAREHEGGGAAVPSPVLTLLAIVAERYNHSEGLARPGFETLMRDTGWSEDTVARALDRAERLGAIDVRRFKGRGKAAEITFTDAVLNAADLRALSDRDWLAKRPHRCGLLPPKKSPQRESQNPANGPDKPRSGAGPTDNGLPERPTYLQQSRSSSSSARPTLTDDDEGRDVAAVLDFYTAMPGTRPKATRADRVTAAALLKQGISLQTIRDGIITAVARRDCGERTALEDLVARVLQRRDPGGDRRATGGRLRRPPGREAQLQAAAPGVPPARGGARGCVSMRDVADNEQLARLRREAAAADTVDGAAVETALDLLERAAGQLPRAGLVVLATRSGASPHGARPDSGVRTGAP